MVRLMMALGLFVVAVHADAAQFQCTAYVINGAFVNQDFSVTLGPKEGQVGSSLETKPIHNPVFQAAGVEVSVSLMGNTDNDLKHRTLTVTVIGRDGSKISGVGMANGLVGVNSEQNQITCYPPNWSGVDAQN